MTAIQYIRYFVSILIFFSATHLLKGQVSLDQRFSFTVNDEALADALVELSIQSGINISFGNDIIGNRTVSYNGQNKKISEILKSLLRGSEVSYKMVGEQVVLYRVERKSKKYIISGYVEDRDTGEKLVAANVIDVYSGQGVITNDYGYFQITVPEGDVELRMSYVGYDPYYIKLRLNQNLIIHGLLDPGLLNEVVVFADSLDSNISTVKPGQTVFGDGEVKKVATLGGELDIYRYMELLPGVYTGTDGVGGLHVRGGDNDQNLILMDGVPIYNPSHLIGIFSVFNPATVKHVDFYKSNFPARYAGRLSSVMDIKTKEGNNRNLAFQGKVGFASASGTIEGPLGSSKNSFIVSGRWFLPSLFIKSITRELKEKGNDEGYTYINFYDLNAKVNFEISPKSKLFVSYYQGRDKFIDTTRTLRLITDNVIIEDSILASVNDRYKKDLNWGNKVGILRWNFIPNEKVFINNTFSYSNYQLQSVDRNDFDINHKFPVEYTQTGFNLKEFKTRIEDLTYRLQIDYSPAFNHFLKSGLFVTYHQFLPKSITLNDASKIDDIYISEGLVDDALFSQFKVNAFEMGLFLEHDWRIGEILRINTGIHGSGFIVEETKHYDVQPRIGLQFKPLKPVTIYGGVSWMTQYLHQLTNSGIGLPTDLWVPVSGDIQPGKSFQYSAGLLINPASFLQIEIEAYKKVLKNLLSYQEGASFLLEEGPLATSLIDAANWQDKVTPGEGMSEGIETKIELNYKTWSINAGYTLSKSTRTFPEVNFGVSFPYRYDQRHSIALNASFDMGKRLTIRGNWVYNSGNAITIAESKFINPGQFFPEVGIIQGGRNAFRLPNYHRLDLGVDMIIGDQEKKAKHSLHLDLYNVYNRENPFYITLVEDPFSSTFEFKQFSIFKFFPSFSYSYTFN